MNHLFCREIIKAGALEIRDLSQKQQPFLYSSGNWGPGYVMIKGLVSRTNLISWLCKGLGEKVIKQTSPDIVAGNVTGGMIPGWLISSFLHIPFIYVRDIRKKGGHKEKITGLNPDIPIPSSCLVVEELVNFAETTVNSALALRQSGFEVSHAATILSYVNPKAIASLSENNLNLISLITLNDLLNEAERIGAFHIGAIRDYRRFLIDPLAWQKSWGLKPVESGGTK